MRFLHRLRIDAGLAEIVIFAVIAERFALEGQQQNIDGLVEPRPAFAEVKAQPFELVGLIAAPQPDIQPAARQQIGGGDLLRHNQGVMQRQHDDGGANPDALGLARQMRRIHQRAREIAIGREMVLRAPDAAEAQLVRRLRDLDAALENLLWRAGAGGLQQQERAEFDLLAHQPFNPIASA